MKKLLLEVYRGSSLAAVAESLQVGTPEGMMRMQGVFGVPDVVNRNSRFYPKTDYLKHIEKLQERIEKYGDVLGEMEHPESMTVNYNNVSHKLEKVWFDEANGNVMGQILLLDTPKGKIAQSIAKSGTPLHISSRAMGAIDKNGAVTLEQLETFDIVGTPGFEQASLYKMNESLDMSGNLIYEHYAYDLDANGKVIDKGSANIIESVEKRMLATIDEKIQEALKTVGSSMTNESVVDIVKKYVTETAAPDIQQYIREQQSDMFVTKAELGKLLDDKFITKYAPVIEKWMHSEFSPMLESWISTEFANTVENWIGTEYSQVVEAWITENYSERVQAWMTEEFAPKIQNWVIEQYTPVVEQWNNEQFAGMIQNWVVEQYTPVVNQWIERRIGRSTAGVTEKQHRRYIDATKVIESIDDLEKRANKASKRVITESAEDKAKREINEHFMVGPAWFKLIPESCKQLYLSLSDAGKRTIAQQASVRNFVTEADIQKFWKTRDFHAIAEGAISPEYVNLISRNRPVNESVDSSNAADLVLQSKYGRK